MKFEPLSIPEVILVTPDVHADDRGFFLETYHREKYRRGGIDGEFVQDNHSRSRRGILRGLHAQSSRPQGKLVRAVEGEIWDVAVDIRAGSPTYGKWVAATLSAESFRQLWIPGGFLHGFCVVSEVAQVEYKCTELYDREDELAVVWDDPDLAIAWPIRDPQLSPKDAAAPRLAELPPIFGLAMNGHLELSNEDRRELAERGIAPTEVIRQLRLLHQPPRPLPLLRPATLGDGIVELEEEVHADLVARAELAAGAGRSSRFVPASGAATRMFRSLVQARSAETDDGVQAGRRFLTEVERFPFYPALQAEMGVEKLAAARRDGDYESVLSALLDSGRLDYGFLPKGLIPFHRYADGTLRTAFEEQLWEGAAQVADRDGLCRLHFTVSPEHRQLFIAAVEAARPQLAAAGFGLEVSFSEQSPSTDTVAGDPHGGLFHDGGHLLFRPGGHGALIANLAEVAELGGDLVTIKNIDNVLPAAGQQPVLHWKKLLTGHLLRLEERLVSLLRRVEAEPGGDWVEEGLRFAAEELAIPWARAAADHGAVGEGGGAGGDRQTMAQGLREALDRPLRVCGVVANTGEPGGGPFWVASSHGPTLQIVEISEIDRQDPAQEAVLQAATHFNPVDIVARIRDHHGRPYDLTDPELVDERASFVTRKSHEGQTILALERPGLWNGAMAGWNTVFVAVPGETFAPVKTVFDLLRPAHQADGERP